MRDHLPPTVGLRPVDFELTAEQRELQAAVRAFAEEVVAPAAAGYDEREESRSRS